MKKTLLAAALALSACATTQPVAISDHNYCLLATGTYAFVGGCEGEAKIMDSMTHQVLVAGVDKRVGGGSLATAAQWK